MTVRQNSKSWSIDNGKGRNQGNCIYVISFGQVSNDDDQFTDPLLVKSIVCLLIITVHVKTI